MRLGPLVLPALIALVAPAQTHAQVPARSVETIHGGGFSIDISASARPTAQPDDVVARLMSFDRNNDGKIEKAELAERMYTVMDRGDANRDGCLDRSELQTLAHAKPAAPVVRGFGHGSYVVGPNAEVSSRLHLEGAIDDLRLEAARKATALGIVTTFSQALDTNAQAELLDVLKEILTPEQLTTFTRTLEQERRMGAQRVVSFVTSPDQPAKIVRFGSLALSERSVATFKLGPEANGRAIEALKQYRSRLRPNETDRVELGRQLASVLTEEESEDFLAAIARQPVAEAGGFFAMTKVVDSLGGAVHGIVVKR
jgi:hypothetical protein